MNKEKELLNDYKIGEFCCFVDILGTANLMSEQSTWYNESLIKIFEIIEISLNESVDLSNSDNNLELRQYTDTICIIGNNAERLVALSKSLQVQGFKKGILLQIGVADGGVYDLSGCSYIKNIESKNPHAFYQLLAGPALAKAYLLLKGVKGPRILIDNAVELKMEGSQKISWGPLLFPLDSRKEVYWWDVIIDFEDVIQKNKTIYREKATLWNSTPQKLGCQDRDFLFDHEKRLATSFNKGLEHLEEFERVIKTYDEMN
ncbi:MAG: hypothetical protein NTY22_06060 [Proteobacteria bacterium]|nr:hypothetical protein [Pseudomonadota bacterium]